MSLPQLATRVLAATLVLTTLTACRSGTRVARIDPNQTVDVSGNWNDTDSKLVADEMIREALGSPWITKWMQAKQGKSPSVVVGAVTNRSTEHINTRTFISNIERAFTNSGAVAVIASGTGRSQARAERADQQSTASADTRARQGVRQGADFILEGELNSIIDQEGGLAVKKYQVNLYLTNVETEVRAWAGEKEIKKVVERSRFRP